MNTRTIHHGLASSIALAVCLGAAASAADPPLISFGETRNWTLHFEVDVRPPRQDFWIDHNGVAWFEPMPSIKVDRATLFAPALESTSSHTVHTDAIESRIITGNIDLRIAPGFTPPNPRDGRYARWDAEAFDEPSVRLIVKIPMTCRETKFDETRARRVAWPSGDWPDDLLPCLQPQMFVDSESAEVRELVNTWLDGNNPRGAPPMLVAKLLASKTIAHVQPTGNGYETNSRGMIEGFNVRNASETARTGRGSPFDMACLFVAACRAAGVPARPVIGYDQRQSERDRFPVFRAWAEFALFDETDGRVEWIPVDVARQREFGSRAPPLERPWDFFGTNEHLDYTLPIAFHFHPPVGAIAHGAPGLWGWRPMPMIPTVEQQLRVFAIETPQRGGRKR